MPQAVKMWEVWLLGEWAWHTKS